MTLSVLVELRLSPSSKCEHSVNIKKSSEVNDKWTTALMHKPSPNTFTAR